MIKLSFFLVAQVFVIVLSASVSSVRAEESEPRGGFFRERIKQRWLKKQQEKPAPTATSETGTKIEKPGDYTFTMSRPEGARYYRVHVPKSYDGKTPVPLLLALHGGGGDMGIQSNDEYYKQISKSEKEGFVVVFPNGFSKLQSGQLATWNAGRCCAAARDGKIDDVGFLREVLKSVTARMAIEPKKIFAAGMSNGGMMSYRLACEMSDVLAGIASVAGTDVTEDCKPKAAIPVLHIHARDDDHVLFGGGAGKTFRDKSLVTDFTSVPSTIAKWVKANGCASETKRVVEKEGATCDRYSSCKDGSRVQLCVTETGGHSWPGGKKPRGGGTPSNAISANDVMWDFFNGK